MTGSWGCLLAMSSFWLPQGEAPRNHGERKVDGTRRGERLTESDRWRIAMKLTLITIAAVLICLLSLAARSWAMRAAESAPPVAAVMPQEKVVLAAVDRHLRGKMRKLARR